MNSFVLRQMGYFLSNKDCVRTNVEKSFIIIIIIIIIIQHFYRYIFA